VRVRVRGRTDELTLELAAQHALQQRDKNDGLQFVERVEEPRQATAAQQTIGSAQRRHCLTSLSFDGHGVSQVA